MKDLANRDQMICYLAAQGHTNAQIADALELESTTIAHKLSEERIQFEVKALRYKLYGKDHKKRFNEILPHAIDVTEGILLDKGAQQKLRFAAAQEVMDRALGKPKQTVEHEGSIVRALFEKLDGKEVTTIDLDSQNIGSGGPTPLHTSLLENPNERVNIDRSENPNLSEDAVDQWAKKNL